MDPEWSTFVADILVWLTARGYFRGYYAAYFLTYCPISLFGFKGASFSLCNGFMESDSSARVEIPANFEDAPVEHLVQLIGELFFHLTFTRHHSSTANSSNSRYDRSINVT